MDICELNDDEPKVGIIHYSIKQEKGGTKQKLQAKWARETADYYTAKSWSLANLLMSEHDYKLSN